MRTAAATWGLVMTMAAPAAAQDLEGVWGGTDDRGRVLSAHFAGRTVVLSDADLVLVATWKGGEAGLHIEVLQAMDRQGGVLALGKTPHRTLAGRLDSERGLCLAADGVGARLTGPRSKTISERCWKVTRAGTDPQQCVRRCVQQNQMRAVGADQIERDCRAECGSVSP